MGASIGIDLGTTNSVCAYTRNGTNPRVLTNRERQNLTPSVIGRHRDGSLLVGVHALRFAKFDPINTIFSIKRLMGRRYDDEQVGLVQKQVSYRIVPCEDGAHPTANVMIGDKQFTPIDGSALILEKIKKDAEEALGESVTHAVITVPAYFDDNQRVATRLAGLRAGLKVKRIIDEPTAAAYAFGMDLDPGASRAIVVYDLGGGTFDISIIFISEGIPTVENISGDIWLGGDKFDAAIMNHVLRRYPSQEQELRASPAFMWDLRQQAEQVKKDLGGAPSSDIAVAGALGGKLDVEVTVTNAEFEVLIQDDIERSVRLVEEALAECSLEPKGIDNVLLVGGSTGLPIVRRLLAKKFGEDKIRANVDPMACVALGAAVLAARTEKKYCPKKECQRENEPDAAKCENSECGQELRDVEAKVKCPHCSDLHDKHEVQCPKTGKALVGGEGGITAKPYGIEVQGGRFEIVVPKGTRYPTIEPMFREFRTSADFVERIVIPVYQGFDTAAAQSNELQGRIVVPEGGPIPAEKRVPKETPLDIGFEIDENGTLTIRVKGKGPLSWLNVGKIVRPYEAGAGQIIGTTETVAPMVACPHCQHKNPKGVATCQGCGEMIEKPTEPGKQVEKWVSDLQFWIMNATTATREYDWALPPKTIQELQSAIDRAQQALDRKDEAAGRLAQENLAELMNKHCGGMQDLVQAALVARLRMGDLAQQQKLASMLEEFKRRILSNESAQSPELQKLRDEINQHVKGILEGSEDRGKVACANPTCGKPRRPPTLQQPACEHCGFNPFLPK